jgi:CBS-domain-containing membrane protein
MDAGRATSKAVGSDSTYTQRMRRFVGDPARFAVSPRPRRSPSSRGATDLDVTGPEHRYRRVTTAPRTLASIQRSCCQSRQATRSRPRGPRRALPGRVEKPALSTLPVLTRFVVSRRAAVEPSSWVPCPRRGPVPIADCHWCKRLRGIGSANHGAAVTCTPGNVGPVRRAVHASNNVSVMQLMARDVFCVTAEAPLDVIADLLADTGLEEVPVVDAAGIPLGVVSRACLGGGAVSPVRDHHARPSDVTFLEGDATPATHRTAAKVMQPVTTSLHYRVSVATAAAIQLCGGASRILVVDDHGALCGILTAQDLARWQSDSRNASSDNESP